MCLVLASQNAASPVRTRPLSGTSVGSTTSKTEMRSLATSSSRSSSTAYSSRTLPLPTCSASGMHGLLPERAQALEDGVDVAHGRREVEDGVERGGREHVADLGGAAHERLEVALLVPRPQRV